MTVEAILAAMAFIANADRRSGNHPDYELEDRLFEQQEREYLEYEYEMRKKYPRDWDYDHFVLHCNVYIPAYKEKVDCIIESSGIHVCKHILIEGQEYYLMVLYGGGYEYFEGDDYWISPEKYNDRTKQMNPSTVEALGYAISCGISKMAGNISDMSKYEEQVNRLIKRDNLVFKADRFEFFHQGIPKAIDLYEYASKGVDLDVVLEDDTGGSGYSSDARISVPFKSISYAGREYMVIPYQHDVCCLCITDNVIMALAIEEEMFILDELQKTLVVKVELRDPFGQKIMNRKDNFKQLEDNDKHFYYEVFMEASKLNDFFCNHSCCDDVREELLEVIENGVLGKRMSKDSLNSKMQELSGKQYTCDFQRIVCNGKESTLYQYCKDVYEYKEEPQMGLFDSFFAGGSNTIVLNYIQNMSKTALVSAVKSEYERIKGNCRYTPAMGEFGSLEFAGALLIWKYCRENIHSNLNVCGELMIMLGENIGCAYNCMSPREWSDKMDVVINNNDLLDYTEWNQIYNYLKDNYLDEIQGLEFNVGNSSQQQRSNTYADFVVKYNSMDDYGSVFEYYRRQGLRLKDDMPFNIN